MALNPEKYFIVVPNMFGNGLSSSPSNTPAPLDGPRFPEARPLHITMHVAEAGQTIPSHHSTCRSACLVLCSGLLSLCASLRFMIIGYACHEFS